MILVSYKENDSLNFFEQGALIYYGDSFLFMEDYSITTKDDLINFPKDTCYQLKLMPFNKVASNAKNFKQIKLEVNSNNETPNGNLCTTVMLHLI